MRVAAFSLLLIFCGGMVSPAIAAAQALPDPLAPLADTADSAARNDTQPATAATQGVAQILTWVTRTGDNGGMPFIIIDKMNGAVFAFDSAGVTLGHAPALIGSATGDDSAPGVGDRELSRIPVGERTTPAGRFVAKFGRAYGNKQVLWVDFPSAVSLHPVITANRKERRLQRLLSETPDDNRITFGCINVPADFYAAVIEPMFEHNAGIVYILPDTKPMAEVFAAAAATAP